MMKLWLFIRSWFDPDRTIVGGDKLQHLVGGFLVCAAVDAFKSRGEAVAWTAALGFAYEAGQADVAHSQGLLGRAGFGIGLLDLACDLVGAAAYVALRVAL